MVAVDISKICRDITDVKYNLELNGPLVESFKNFGDAKVVMLNRKSRLMVAVNLIEMDKDVIDCICIMHMENLVVAWHI
jgi:hypothetical protein